MPTRRHFLELAAGTLLLRSSFAQGTSTPTTRPNLAVIDRDRILVAAHKALVRTDTDLPADLPALAAAALIDPAPAYVDKAAALLDTFLKETKAAPSLTSYEPLLDRVSIAELAQAIPFLHLDSTLDARIKQWFAIYLSYLTDDRTALLARDARDRHASSWLLQTTACARLTMNDIALADNRHRVRATTLRAQINADGLFPHELKTENPLRNSLFNLDLLAGTCQLLSTRFESVWAYELQDGPGMRAALARHAVYIRNPHAWPYPSDATHFKLLPGRRPALLFGARAFNQPDYAALWQTLNPDPADPDILQSFPIRQPILWRPGI